MLKLDIRQTYFQLPKSEHYRCLFGLNCYHVPRNYELLEINCLLFAFASDSKIFLCETNCIAEVIRSYRIKCIQYLEGFFIADKSNSFLKDDAVCTRKIIRTLGFMGNIRISVFVSVQCINCWHNLTHKMQSSLHRGICTYRYAKHFSFCSNKLNGVTFWSNLIFQVAYRGRAQKLKNHINKKKNSLATTSNIRNGKIWETSW